MANRRPERVSLPASPQRTAPMTRIEAVPMISARGLARAASESDGSAEIFAAAAQSFGRVADTVGKIADEAARHEGAQAGAVAGLDREFRPRGDATIYSRAHDAAGIQTFKSQMAVDLAAQMEKAYDDNQGNPEGLKAALEGVKAGWQETVDKPVLAPHIKPEFEAQFARSALGFMRSATREFNERQRAELAGALEAEREMRSRTAEQQAFRLGLDETADQVLAGELTDMRQRLAVVGHDGKPIVSPEAQTKVLRSAETGIARARILGAYSRLDSLPAKAKFIADLEEKYQAGGDRVLDLFDPEQFQAVIGTLTSQARQQELGAAQATRELKRQLKDFADGAKSGIALRDDELAGLKARVAASGDAEVIATFDQAIDTLGVVRELNTMRPAAIEGWVDRESERLLKEGASLEVRDASRLDIARGYLKNAHSELANDMLGFAAKAGTANVDPIDLTDPASMARRDETAMHAAEFYGRHPQRFRPEEKEALAAVSRKGGDEMIAVAAALTAGFKENAPAALAEISKEAPALAMIGGLWTAIGGNAPPQAAIDASKGIALRAHAEYRELATTEQMLAETAAVVGGSYANLATDRSALINTAKAIYEAKAYAAGTRTFDPSLWQQSVRSALGEREVDGAKFGGVVRQRYWFADDGPEIVLPPAVRQDKWREVVEMITPGDLDRAGIPRPVGVDGKPINMARIQAGLLVQTGNGRYAVALGKANVKGAEDYVPGWRLDLNALIPHLRRRRPDLFSGG